MLHTPLSIMLKVLTSTAKEEKACARVQFSSTQSQLRAPEATSKAGSSEIKLKQDQNSVLTGKRAC